MLIACDKVPILDRIINNSLRNIGNLYVGDIVANNELLLKEKEISIIIRVAKQPIFELYSNISMVNTNKKFENIEYHFFPIEDNRNENISVYFEETNLIISTSIENNKNILVHCENGVSRSVTIILAYLIKIKNMKLKDALSLVKNTRTSTFTRPNSGFAKQLLKY